MIESSVYNCPVPTEQQPCNEYEELKTSWLFRHSTLGLSSYLKRIFWIWAISLFVAVPVAAASFPLKKDSGHFILCAAAAACIGLVLALIRLYLGWIYISSRLNSPVVFYEESGWYDGQTWTKPEEILSRDRLIVNYEIRPILTRIKLTFVGLAGLLVVGSIVWQLL
ncbi:MAG: CGLD27 family protein [Cyanobacteria bacterium P01_A01_bin.45]